VGALPSEPDIQLILKIRKSFGKYQLVFLKNPKKSTKHKKIIHGLFPTVTTNS
jgi:hypothetical protein